jgi:hypothetical protein
VFQKENTVAGGELHIRNTSRLGTIKGTALCGVKVGGLQESKEVGIAIEEIETYCLEIAKQKGILILT